MIERLRKIIRWCAWSQRSGASYVEVAVAIPVFIVAMIAFIDLARYWAVRTIAQFGVNAGAALAAKVDGITIDDRYLDTNDPAQLEQLLHMVNARNAVIAEASRVAMGILIHKYDEGGMVKAVPFTVKNGSDSNGVDSGGTVSPDQKSIIVLRPGDVFQRTNSPANDPTSYFAHESNCGNPSVCEKGCPPDPPVLPVNDHCNFIASFPALFKVFPIEVYAELQFSWLLPIMGQSTIRVRAFSYRERTWDGAVIEPFGETPPLEPTPTNTPAPTGTATQVPTSTIANTPTTVPTATETATGTPPTATASPTITNTPLDTLTPTITPTPQDTLTPTITPTPLNTSTPTKTPKPS